MAEVFIDGRRYETEPGKNMLEVSLSAGIDLPYFCWHPELRSVGACRQCAVKQYKDESDPKGKVVMACMTPAQEGTRISVRDNEAAAFRKSIIEWLMINHPHDCPVCDEGGECHLQDMTVMTGHNYRRYRFKKRTYRNQYLGPLVNHEMNRCIQCYRCVRFYRDYAEGTDLREFAAHDHVYFGRHEDGVLQSPFSGNLVEVCPTGVFTDKTLKQHYTRKWDLATAPSVCVHCGVGCNTTPGERYGELRRIRTRYHHDVNRYFLCDRGRYGYEFVNHERRLRAPLAPQGTDTPAETLSAEDALSRLKSLMAANSVIGIGSPRASLESNFALRKLVGPSRFFQGVPEPEHRALRAAVSVLQQGPSRTPSLREVAECDALFILGEDLTHTAPMLALAVRQASRSVPRAQAEAHDIPSWHDAAIRSAIGEARSPMFIASVGGTDLDNIATATFQGSADELVRLAAAVTHELDASAPKPSRLSAPQQKLAREIAEALSQAERPLVIAGVSQQREDLVLAAANAAWACGRERQAAALSYVVPECNSLGLAMLGGEDLDAALALLQSGEASTVVVLENDLYERAPHAQIDAALSGAQHLVVLDHVAHDTAARAELVLPAATFAESHGSFVNHEGRAQRFYPVFVPAEPIAASYRWLTRLAEDAGMKVDAVVGEIAQEIPELAPLATLHREESSQGSPRPYAREPHRYSGRTSQRVHLNIHEQAPPADPESSFVFSMEGSWGRPGAEHEAEFWAPGFNSIQSLTRFQDEVNGPLRSGPRGVRLIEPHAGRQYFEIAEPNRDPTDDQLDLYPRYQVFGSEPLSMLSPSIAELAPLPRLALSQADAERLQLQDEDTALLEVEDAHHSLSVSIDADLKPGMALIPARLWRTLPRDGFRMNGRVRKP